MVKKFKLNLLRLVSCDENFASEMRSISSLMILLQFALKPQKRMKSEPRFRFKFSHSLSKAPCQPIGFCHILGKKFSFRVCQTVLLNAWKRCIWDGYSMSSFESANVSGTDCSFCDTNSTKKSASKRKSPPHAAKMACLVHSIHLLFPLAQLPKAHLAPLSALHSFFAKLIPFSCDEADSLGFVGCWYFAKLTVSLHHSYLQETEAVSIF